MSQPACVIRLDPPKVDGEVVRLDGWLDTPGLPPRHLFFEFTCPDPSQARLSARPFVLAFLPVAMRLGLPLVCEHPIDRVTRDNLHLWQATFANWLPTRLRRVELRMPVVERQPGCAGGGAITAFSGGSDSCYTALTYPRTGDCPLVAGLMIHGFDIPLEDERGFAIAWENSRAMLDAYGLRAHWLRTNIRAPRRPKLCWERETHGIWLAAALACLEPWHGALIIPSSYPNHRPRIPFGSNAVTDPLLGGAGAPFIHHRGDIARSEKFAVLARDPVATARMRVCFLDARPERNCGRCFKCVSSQALLWAHGMAAPAAFPVRATARDIAETPMEDRDAERLVATMKEIREAAHAAGLGEVVEALDRAIERGRSAALREERRRRRRNLWLRWLGFGQ